MVNGMGPIVLLKTLYMVVHVCKLGSLAMQQCEAKNSGSVCNIPIVTDHNASPMGDFGAGG